jgi:hypothetical protein
MIMLHHIQNDVLNNVHTCFMLWNVLHVIHLSMANSTLANKIVNKLSWHDFNLNFEHYHDNMLI